MYGYEGRFDFNALRGRSRGVWIHHPISKGGKHRYHEPKEAYPAKEFKLLYANSLHYCLNSLPGTTFAYGNSSMSYTIPSTIDIASTNNALFIYLVLCWSSRAAFKNKYKANHATIDKALPRSWLLRGRLPTANFLAFILLLPVILSDRSDLTSHHIRTC